MNQMMVNVGPMIELFYLLVFFFIYAEYIHYGL